MLASTRSEVHTPCLNDSIYGLRLGCGTLNLCTHVSLKSEVMHNLKLCKTTCIDQWLKNQTAAVRLELQATHISPHRSDLHSVWWQMMTSDSIQLCIIMCWHSKQHKQLTMVSALQQPQSTQAASPWQILRQVHPVQEFHLQWKNSRNSIGLLMECDSTTQTTWRDVYSKTCGTEYQYVC